MYHAQWAIILDDEFLEAYQRGIVILCCDGIRRRFYPRIFVYSADYREKQVPFDYLNTFGCNLKITCRILLACIRSLGHCPCPRCLIPLDAVVNMGKLRDMAQRETLARDDNESRRRVTFARKSIYEENHAVNSAAVESLLQADSLVPTAVSNTCHLISSYL